MRGLTRDQETMVCNGFESLAVIDGAHTIFRAEAAREMARISEAAGPGDIARAISVEATITQHLGCAFKAHIDQQGAKGKVGLREQAVQVTLGDADSIRDSSRVQIEIVKPLLHATLQTHEHFTLIPADTLSLPTDRQRQECPKLIGDDATWQNRVSQAMPGYGSQHSCKRGSPTLLGNNWFCDGRLWMGYPVAQPRVLQAHRQAGTTIFTQEFIRLLVVQ